MSASRTNLEECRMSESSATHRALVLLERLERANRIAKRCTDELKPLLATTADERLANLTGSMFAGGDGLLKTPIVDGAAMTVTWAGRSCLLGNTVPFHLMDRLARRPNQYVTFDRLIRDVWAGNIRSDDTIRSSIRNLKTRLVVAGMEQLASFLRGERRHYGLFLPTASS